MPEVQEVFRMATQKIRPEPGALDRQHENQRRLAVSMNRRCSKSRAVRRCSIAALPSSAMLCRTSCAVTVDGKGAPNDTVTG